MYSQFLKYTWWIDSGATVHVANSLEGFHSTRTMQRSKRRIEVANGVQANFKPIGHISLELADGFMILLRDVLFVPSLHRNLISVSYLDKDSYECYFALGKCAIWFKDACLGFALLLNELYLISLREKVHSVCNVNEQIFMSNKEQKKRKRTHDSSKLCDMSQNVSIIFDAPCLFIHHLLCVLFRLHGIFMHFLELTY
jgi:hypothetical protein